jgi:hypothetical protein
MIKYEIDFKSTATSGTVFKVKGDSGPPLLKSGGNLVACVSLASFNKEYVAKRKKAFGKKCTFYGGPAVLAAHGAYSGSNDIAVVHRIRTCRGLILASGSEGLLKEFLACHFSGSGSDITVEMHKKGLEGKEGETIKDATEKLKQGGNIYAVCVAGPGNESRESFESDLGLLLTGLEVKPARVVCLWKASSLGLSGDGSISVSEELEDRFS